MTGHRTTLALDPPQPWMRHAACRNLGPATFYDWEQRHGAPGTAAAVKARAICNACTVRAECLNYALDTEQPYGIWAGHTPDERTALLRSRRSA